MPTGVAAAIVFALSLGLLLIRPRRVPDWAAALGGGLAMVALGILPLQSAAKTLAGAWNVFLFFLGLGLSAAVADRAGLFRAAAGLAVRVAGGNQRTLLLALGLFATAITVVLSNDATALLLTPVAFAIATRLGLDPRPYAFTCAFVANAASFVLPVSNPSNLLVLAQAPMSLATFLSLLLVPAALAITATLAGMLLYFRSELATPFEITTASPPLELDSRVKVALTGVAALAILYVIAAARDWPLGAVAFLGSIALLVLDTATGHWEPKELAREIPWAIFPLFGGLLLLVAGLERAGVVSPLVDAISASADLIAGVPAVVFGMAILANVLNNLPAALVAGTALGGLPPGLMRSDIAAAVIVGVNVGPNLTTAGSLATMLWLLLLRRRGIDVSAATYLRVGIIVTLPALAASAAGLWLITVLAG